MPTCLSNSSVRDRAIEAAQVAGRERPRERRLDLRPGHELAMADHLAIAGRRVTAGQMLREIGDGRDWRRLLPQLSEMPAIELGRAKRDAKRAGQAGGTDPGRCDPVALGQDLDLIILELRRRPEPGIEGVHRLARECRQDTLSPGNQRLQRAPSHSNAEDQEYERQRRGDHADVRHLMGQTQESNYKRCGNCGA